MAMDLPHGWHIVGIGCLRLRAFRNCFFGKFSVFFVFVIVVGLACYSYGCCYSVCIWVFWYLSICWWYNDAALGSCCLSSVGFGFGFGAGNREAGKPGSWEGGNGIHGFCSLFHTHFLHFRTMPPDCWRSPVPSRPCFFAAFQICASSIYTPDSTCPVFGGDRCPALFPLPEGANAALGPSLGGN